MDTDKILRTIREEFQERLASNNKVQGLINKIYQGKATYADAQDIAIQAGDTLSDLFRQHLPDALVDGRLYEETADKLIRQPLMDAYRVSSSNAAEVQRHLNDSAGIGIDAIVPEANTDQIDGIIHGISSAQDYYYYQESFLDQVENFAEGVVDDTVRANADFQYKSGLSPVIERLTDGKCCPWCSKLAGTYLYADVSDSGNDVFRRHKNCHCQVLYNPRDGSKKRQNVYSRAWTDEGKDDKINYATVQNEAIKHIKVRNSDLQNGLQIKGIPNSIVDKINDHGEVLQRRKYGKDGLALVDYDLSDHGEKIKHPTGAHKHVFDYTKKGKPRRLNADMTDADLIENSDIIIKGKNYHEQK